MHVMVYCLITKAQEEETFVTRNNMFLAKKF